jgi:hypothetical protein
MKPLRLLVLLMIAVSSLPCPAANELDAADTILFYGGGLVERILEEGELEARLLLA